MKKIKIYSNKRDVKHLERIFLALEVGKKLRRRHAQKKRGVELKGATRWSWSKNVLGWKKCFWAEKRLGWKIKGNSPKEKKKKAGRKEEKKKGRLTRKQKRKRSVQRWKKKKKMAGTEKGCWKEKAGTENFSAFIFLQIFSEKLWWIRLCWI